MKHTRKVKHVALAFPLTVPHHALTLRGITDYAQQHTKWTFITCPPTLSGAEVAVHFRLKSAESDQVKVSFFFPVLPHCPRLTRNLPLTC